MKHKCLVWFIHGKSLSKDSTGDGGSRRQEKLIGFPRASGFRTGAQMLSLGWRCWLMSITSAGLAADPPATNALRQTEPIASARSSRSAESRGNTDAPVAGQTDDSQREDRALREEQLDAARQLEAAFPTLGGALYVVGWVHSEQGDSTAAIRYWESIIRMAPDAVPPAQRADACYNLGYAFLLREDYAKAVPALRESLRLNPRHPEAHYRLAHALFLQGKMEECLQVLEEGKLDTPLSYRLRGQASQHLGKLDEARRNYETAVRLNPNLAEAYYGLAMTYARLGETAQAEESRKQFDALKSQTQVMGRQARGDFNPLAITRRNLAQTHTEIGRVYLSQGKIGQAERLWLRAAEVDPGNTACRFQLVMLYQKAQRNEAALKLCREMIQAEPSNALHYLGLGNLHARLQQFAEAESAFKKVVELGPRRSEGYFALAQLYLSGNTHLTEALELARQSVQMAPIAPNYYVLSQACVKNGDLPGAKAAIEKACAIDPRNPQYQEWRTALSPRK